MTTLSDTAVVNYALALLGQDFLTDFEVDDNKVAIVANLIYADVRDATLRAFPWNFALHRASLNAPLSQTPAFGWNYQFVLPTTPYCLRVLRRKEHSYKFKVEGRRLLANDSEVSIQYIKRVEDVSQFDPLFKSAFAARLAADLAMPITKDKALVEGMWQLYQLKLEEAYEIDSQEGTLDDLISEDLEEVRI